MLIHVQTPNLFLTFLQDNTLDFLEYVAALHLIFRGNLEDRLKWSFKMYDKDGNGKLDRQEVKRLIRVRKKPYTLFTAHTVSFSWGAICIKCECIFSSGLKLTKRGRFRNPNPLRTDYSTVPVMRLRITAGPQSFLRLFWTFLGDFTVSL